MAFRTGLGNELPPASAAGAGGGDLENALRTGDHPPAVADRTGDLAGAGSGAAAATGGAGPGPGHLDGHFGAQGGIHEVQGQIIPQVAAGQGPSLPGAEIRETEEIFENVAEAAEDVGEIVKTGEAGGRDALVTVMIIKPPFFRVPQDLVSFGGFLEFFFGFFIAGIAVWMILEGNLAVLLLDVGGGGVACHPQNAIVIFVVCSHSI